MRRNEEGRGQAAHQEEHHIKSSDSIDRAQLRAVVRDVRRARPTTVAEAKTRAERMRQRLAALRATRPASMVEANVIAVEIAAAEALHALALALALAEAADIAGLA